MARRSKKLVVAKVIGCNMTLDFNYKPDARTRNIMKDCHFRWSPSKGVWYGKSTQASRRMANSLEYLQDFVPTPKATEKDFQEWEKSLKLSEWHDISVLAEDVFEECGDGMTAMNKVLHEKFDRQWC